MAQNDVFLQADAIRWARSLITHNASIVTHNASIITHNASIVLSFICWCQCQFNVIQLVVAHSKKQICFGMLTCDILVSNLNLTWQTQFVQLASILFFYRSPTSEGSDKILNVVRHESGMEEKQHQAIIRDMRHEVDVLQREESVHLRTLKFIQRDIKQVFIHLLTLKYIQLQLKMYSNSINSKHSGRKDILETSIKMFGIESLKIFIDRV